MPGRVDDIITRVRTLMNDTGSSSYFTGDTEVLTWINMCVRELAYQGIFETSSDISTVADQATVDLQTEFSDFVQLLGLWWKADRVKLRRLPSLTKYQQALAVFSSGSRPFAYYCDGTTVSWVPVPSEGVTDAVICLYSSLPSDLDNTTNYTPPTPAAYDDVFVYYCLWQAYLRERTTPNNLATYYQRMYEQMRFRLKASYMPPGRITGYR